MKYYLFFIGIFTFLFINTPSFSADNDKPIAGTVVVQQVDEKHNGNQQEEHASEEHDDEEQTSDHKEPPLWSVIPFILLLGMIATGPLFYEHFWHRNYPKISVALAIIVVGYYLFGLHNTHTPVHSAFEYIQFISLLTGLFVASGGIVINVDKKSTPMANSLILLAGAVIANIIGTTGASMLLIRPFIRLNRTRIKAYHIIFFIFIVSNIGGSLTPIGDPPLFLGFLKGVPFFWTMTHNFVPWVVGVITLTLIFYWIDSRNKQEDNLLVDNLELTNKVTMKGNLNFVWLGMVVGSVFLDPNVFDWVPGIHYHGQKFSYIREIIMLSAAFFSYRFANRATLEENEFSFEPIREVAFIFVGIFGTMMPALELVGNFAQSEAGAPLINQNTLYWGTGLLSGFLDNAPTYLNFLAAGMAAQGASINNVQDVADFAAGNYENSILFLKAISIGAVFFGAFTYIGNGPNFMVKSIAEQIGIKMPSFFGYIVRYSIPFLFPLLILTWLIFFAFQG